MPFKFRQLKELRGDGVSFPLPNNLFWLVELDDRDFKKNKVEPRINL